MLRQFSQPFADHFLQQEIASRLAVADGPLSFSQLKDDGIENSLFMYHAHKLIARGVIEKVDGGFRLSKRGAHWVNLVGLDVRHPKLLPRPLVQLVVQDDNGNVLLSVRQGQLKVLINEYLLPGKLHVLGMLADEAAEQTARAFFGHDAPACQRLTTVEVIHKYGDEILHHALAQVYSLTVAPGLIPVKDDLFNFEWVPVEEILAGSARFNKREFLSQFINELQRPDIAPYMSFCISDK